MTERFGTAGIRGGVGDAVTAELALAVGRAVGREAETVAVGRDGRCTGSGLADAVAAGVQSAGADAVVLGEVPTPTLAFASRGRHGIQVTASHNPPADNGLKLFADGSEYDREGEQRVEAAIDAGDTADWEAWGERREDDAIPDYLNAVTEFAARHGADPAGLSVLVDCGNGMAGVATPQALTTLGADVTALGANVDGRFPERPSKPTGDTLGVARETLRDAAGTVGANAPEESAPNGPDDAFDFAVAHDGDADRTVVLDSAGEVVHEDTVLAILAEHYVRRAAGANAADESAPDAAREHALDDPVVVTTPNASARIDERVKAAGGRVERVRLGALHEGVAAHEGVVFAAEPWKHMHTAFGGWIDGVCSAAVLARLVADAGGLDALRDPVTERPYRKVNVDCPDAEKDAAMSRLRSGASEAFPDADIDTEYGVRLDFADGSWALIRPSGTEPYLRVYVESEAIDELVERATDFAADAVRE